jgi:hypothetical protein
MEGVIYLAWRFIQFVQMTFHSVTGNIHQKEDIKAVERWKDEFKYLAGLVEKVLWSILELFFWI